MSTTLIIILSVVYAVGAIFWMAPSAQDFAATLKSDRDGRLASLVEFALACLLMALFWWAFTIYRIVTWLPGFIEEHVPAP